MNPPTAPPRCRRHKGGGETKRVERTSRSLKPNYKNLKDSGRLEQAEGHTLSPVVASRSSASWSSAGALPFFWACTTRRESIAAARRPKVLNEDVARLPRLALSGSNLLRGCHCQGAGCKGVQMSAPRLLQGSEGRRPSHLRTVVPVRPGRQ